MATCGQEDPDKVAQMDAIWQKYLDSHTAVEVEAAFMAAGMPTSKLNNAEDAYRHPHWQARGDFINIKDVTSGDEFVDIATSPKFNGTPCTVYKGAPLLGQESERVMKDILGYDDDRIEALKESGSVAASLITK